ncbi:hypothetical protein SLEP1_g51831 [Rubroshorea leprosula]|uniref:CG-1 domain-containing protein n=1 Tax=Rubroshorea leprosula TaxID=152421 RepID=A0AAV5M856_9ROSI|nr:hypothetical protein SLEP1_g51831 [Rubroshorea leprosula]
MDESPETGGTVHPNSLVVVAKGQITGYKKEGHKKLKAGSIDVLNCYYALGDENKNFQRRCYSMVEKDFSHIVLVHYLELTVNLKSSLELINRTGTAKCFLETWIESIEDQSLSSSHPDTVDKFLSDSVVRGPDFKEHSQIRAESKGRMENFSCVKKTEGEIPHSQVTEKIMPNSEIDGSLSSGSCPNNCLEDTCLNSAQPLERENALSAIPGIDLAPTQSDKGKSDNDAEATDYWLESIIFELLKDDSESCPCSESMEDQSLSSSSHLNNASFDRGLDFKEHSQICAE